jgi:alkyldihydroxyacetonephosphate synthase
MKGASAVREIAQSGLNPSNCRLVDPIESLSMGLGDGENSILILGFESSTIDNFDVPMTKLLGICAKWEGKYRFEDVATKSSSSGERDGAAGQWRNNFLKAPYLRVSEKSIILFIAIADIYYNILIYYYSIYIYYRII